MIPQEQENKNAMQPHVKSGKQVDKCNRFFKSKEHKK